jgi:spore coat protein A, manganese oxidase
MKPTRREFLEIVAAAGAATIVPWPRADASALPVTGLKKYVDALPLPGVIQPSGMSGGIAQYSVGMTQFTQKVHRDLPPTSLWGYNGSWPGPTFEAFRGSPIDVRFTNSLPRTHLFESAYDTSLHGTDMGEPHVRSVVHLHGARILPISDGAPEAWFTRGFAQTGPLWETKVYRYPNDQPATNLWYHDHSLGITRLNVLTGLEGFYFIRDEVEDGLNLPRGRHEVPLVIQDRLFNRDGSLLYPIVTGESHQVWIPEFFGDTACVNGKAWPFLDVEPRKYRFRILNGSNARFYHLTLADSAGNGNPGPDFNQIGSDGGLFPAPVALTELLMAPAERFDVVIDFSGCEGRRFTLFNDAPAPFPGGGQVDLPEIMQFRVTSGFNGYDNSSLPSQLVPMTMIDPRSAARERFIMISEADQLSDGFPIIGELGGSPLLATADNPTGGLHFSDPVTETVKAGSTELWNLVNITTDGHPIHIHLVQFQVLDRRTFDIAHYMATGKVKFTGKPIAPAPNERPAWKDTVKAFPGLDPVTGSVTGLVTRVIAKYDLPTGTPVTPGEKFRYIYHCHILEHEDNEMMRPFDVVV